MDKIKCPFCGGDAHILDWQSICKVCFRRWETNYTEKLYAEYKGEFYGKKSERQKETKT
jgi:hypothetical protein